MADDFIKMGRKMAKQDGEAFTAAREAVQDWLATFPQVAQAAGESDGGVTGPPQMMTEAFAAASATRAAIAAGDGVGEIFGEQIAIAQEQQQLGKATKEWVVAFFQIRCIAIGYMLGFLGDGRLAQEFGALFREFREASE